MLSGRGCEREGATASVPSRWFFGFRRFFFFFQFCGFMVLPLLSLHDFSLTRFRGVHISCVFDDEFYALGGGVFGRG